MLMTTAIIRTITVMGNPYDYSANPYDYYNYSPYNYDDQSRLRCVQVSPQPMQP